MLDYIWSISDEALRDGRNQPPKPECLSASATYAFVCFAPSQRRPGGERRIDGVRFENVQASTSWWVKNMEFRDDRLAIAKRGALLCSICNGQSPVGAAGLGGFFLASGSSSIGAVAMATENSLISRCLLMEDMVSSKSPFRQAAAAACCWASLGGLTNKAGMSFSFRGMMLATPRSIKDSR